MSELFRYIRRLIDIPSVSGEEGDVARFLEGDLAAKGFDVELQEVAPGRLNVHATNPGAAAPRIYFNTHIDTVPPFYESSEDESTIYGRGSCDAKGILAAMVHAAMELRDGGISDVGMLFVVGEEVDSVGALAANERGAQSSYVIVGEPTENKMATGHKGGFKFRLEAAGKAAHSAYPHLGDSATEHLLAGLHDILEEDWGTNDVLGPATVNVGTLKGGLAANVLPPSAESEVFVRVVGAARDVHQKLDSILERHPKLSYQLIAQSDAVFCETVDGFDVAPVSFGTDIPSLTKFGKPLLLGPGSIHDAHTSNEKIGKDEATEAVSYYQSLVKKLLATI